MAGDTSPNGADVVVTNVVGSGSIGREVDLRAVGEDLRNAHVRLGAEDYNPEALYIRRDREGPVVMVFPSGKYVLAGLTSVRDVHDLRDWFLDELCALGLNSQSDSFEIKNVVAVGDAGRALDLERLVTVLGFDETGYEPEQHPALNFRPKRFDVLLRIFASGRIVIQGATSSTEAQQAFSWFLSRLA